MPTIWINKDIHFTLEKIEKIEVMKANKLLKKYLQPYFNNNLEIHSLQIGTLLRISESQFKNKRLMYK